MESVSNCRSTRLTGEKSLKDIKPKGQSIHEVYLQGFVERSTMYLHSSSFTRIMALRLHVQFIKLFTWKSSLPRWTPMLQTQAYDHRTPIVRFILAVLKFIILAAVSVYLESSAKPLERGVRKTEPNFFVSYPISLCMQFYCLDGIK